MADKPTSDFRPPEHRAGAGPREATTPEQPYIDPSVRPVVSGYVEGMVARAAQRRGGPPKYTAPVGGGPAPPIPRLDAEHEAGKTMASQAERTNTPPIDHVLMRQGQNPQSIVEPPVAPGLSQQQQPKHISPESISSELGLTAGDLLPPEAQQDPTFRKGAGAMFAASQPHLAAQYGVVRNGHRIPPQQLRTANRPQGQPRDKLRPETLQDLQRLEHFMATGGPPSEEQEDEEAQAQVEQTAAGVSKHAGRVHGGERQLTEEEIRERVELMDSFDHDGLRQAMIENILNTPDQRKIVEDRLKPLDIDELVMKNRVKQRVPIIPGKFEVTYGSMTGEDDLELKRLIMLQSKAAEVTERYLLDKYAFMAITCGVVAINNNPLPSHLDNENRFDEKLFWEKYDWMMQRPLHMLASIGVHHTFFEMRVRKLFKAELVGNT